MLDERDETTFRKKALGFSWIRANWQGKSTKASPIKKGERCKQELEETILWQKILPFLFSKIFFFLICLRNMVYLVC